MMNLSYLKNRPIRMVLCCSVLASCLCNRFDPTGISPGENNLSAAQITVSTGNVATLAKRQTIDLDRLILTLTSPGEDTIRDTTALSGAGGSNAIKTIGNLVAPRQWSLTAATYDKSDSVVHYGVTAFTTIPADTIDVALNLDAKYSMLRVSFNDIPDSARELSFTINGVTRVDSTLTAPGTPNTVVLGYDYLNATPAGTTHTISLRVRGSYFGTETVLFTADTTVIARSGENKTHNITCRWTGPVINNPPVFVSDSSDMLDSVYAGTLYLDTLYGTDPDGDRFTYTLITKPAAMTLTDSIINWTPAVADTGTHAVSATINDWRGGADTLTWTILVKAAPAGNQAPAFSTVSSDMRPSIKVDSLYVDTVHATDADGDPITFTFKDSVAGMQLVDSIISWTPGAADVGNKSVSVIVRDVFGGSDTLEWSIVVVPNTTTPVYPLISYDTILSGEINPGTDIDHYQFQGTAGDRITLRASHGSSVISRTQIVSPTASVLISQNVNYGTLNSIEDFVLPATGLYTIRIMNATGNVAFNYYMSLYSNQYTRENGTTIGIGDNVSDSLTTRVDVNRYLFNGTAGERITIRLYPVGSENSRVQIVSPTDSVVINQNVNSGNLNSIEDYLLPSTGKYIIRITGTAAFKFTMSLF